MPKKYHIAPLTWLIRDEAGVRFHVKSDDYFGTLATVLSLLRQQAKKDGRLKAAALKSLDNLEKDLLLLQKEYRIETRPALSARPATSGRPVKPRKPIKALRSETRTGSRKAS